MTTEKLEGIDKGYMHFLTLKSHVPQIIRACEPECNHHLTPYLSFRAPWGIKKNSYGTGVVGTEV